ncbi:MAG: hypothetical protein ACO20H_10240 [Bacteriovoracaceae bacterium]
MMKTERIIENLPIEIVCESFKELLKKEYFLFKLVKEKGHVLGEPSCPYFLFFGNYFQEIGQVETMKFKFSESHMRKILNKYFDSKEKLEELMKEKNKEFIYIDLELAKLARKSFRLLSKD